MLKMAHHGLDVSQEIEILMKVGRNTQCTHLPELVCSPTGNKELRILPVSKVINFEQPANTACKVVQGMVDRLQYLHSQGIIHQDIWPFNLIMQGTDVVIVNFEMSILVDKNTEVSYEGGCIC
jgi:serine/threonine protein kinase